MRVLVAQIPMPANRYLADLNNELATCCELVHGSDEFWDMRGVYDIVHLHFPEYLTYDLQDACRLGLTDEMIAETEKRLHWWSRHSRLVFTRHNIRPHHASSDPRWEKMYEMVCRYASGVAHFAQASMDEFRSRYAGTRWFHVREPLHRIIPHHNYTSLPNAGGREDARRRLGIDRNARVVLVFGAVRNEAEKRLIWRMFKGLRAPGKLLLATRWHETPANVSWIRLKYWIRDLTRWWYHWHPSYHLGYGFVAEAETQYYLNAADVLFIPRFSALNSGNVALGMTFGRVVVGPDCGNIGEILSATGNPVYDPARPETAVTSVMDGLRLAREGKMGPANQTLALQQWQPARCAREYMELYRRVMESARA